MHASLVPQAGRPFQACQPSTMQGTLLQTQPQSGRGSVMQSLAASFAHPPCQHNALLLGCSSLCPWHGRPISMPARRSQRRARCCTRGWWAAAAAPRSRSPRHSRCPACKPGCVSPPHLRTWHYRRPRRPAPSRRPRRLGRRTPATAASLAQRGRFQRAAMLHMTPICKYHDISLLHLPGELSARNRWAILVCFRLRVQSQ